jgi:hypothetical protein
MFLLSTSGTNCAEQKARRAVGHVGGKLYFWWFRGRVEVLLLMYVLREWAGSSSSSYLVSRGVM